MQLAVVGDLHGDFDALGRVMALEHAVGAWLCVGDVASDAGCYPQPSRPFYFIKGNNEDFDVIARLATGEAVAPHVHLIRNGSAVDLDGVRVAGLGGTFAPKWYDTAPHDLPSDGRAGLQTRRAGGPSGPPHHDDKRRHFVRAEVEACLALRGVDLLLCHEAPRPYWVGVGPRRNDAGKTAINQVLAAMQPRLHVFGHHHRHTERLCEGVPSIGLPLVGEGYLLVDTERWSWQFRAPGNL